MHTKTLVVDGVWSMFGSANFDNRSLELNDELNVAVTSRDLAARLLAGLRAGPQGVAQRLELATLAAALAPRENPRAILGAIRGNVLTPNCQLPTPNEPTECKNCELRSL